MNCASLEMPHEQQNIPHNGLSQERYSDRGLRWRDNPPIPKGFRIYPEDVVDGRAFPAPNPVLALSVLHMETKGSVGPVPWMIVSYTIRCCVTLYAAATRECFNIIVTHKLLSLSPADNIIDL